MARFFTTIELGPKRSLTPEGFLLCKDVTLARVGEYIYGPGETPVRPKDGMVIIQRDENEVFRPETIASFEGKPVTIDHPPVDVTPLNWRQFAHGHMMNVHRGDGDEATFLIGDLLIMEANAIRLVDDGKREVSLGYDAEYDELEPGRGRQWNIIGNHVALVDRGRCGLRCSIGDKENAMATRTRDDGNTSIWARLRATIMSGDKDAAEAVIKEAETSRTTDGVHIHLDDGGSTAIPSRRSLDAESSVLERMQKLEESHDEMKGMIGKVADAVAKMSKDRRSKDKDEEEEEAKKAKDAEAEKEKEEKEKTADNTALEGTLEMEAPPGTGDSARKARDSAFLDESHQETVALAEIIAPGIAIPKFDVKAPPKRSLDAITTLRRTALDLAFNRAETRSLIENAIGIGRKLDTARMTHDGVRVLFRSVGSAARARNGGTDNARHHSISVGGGDKGINSLAELNKRNRDKYATSK